MRLYGIKNCDSVRKAVKFLKAAEIDFETVDFRDRPVGCETIGRWLKHTDVDTLLNTRGATYRKLGLKSANLDEAAKRKWLCRENMLIKRPVLERDDGSVIVGYDEEIYKELFNGQHHT
ncbi:arsenate reductase family protein [Hydrogenimonas sp.]